MNKEKILKQILKRLDRLEAVVFGGEKQKNKFQKSVKGIDKSQKVASTEIDFNIPIRPFIKRYAIGMNGQKKFTLLLARLTKGDLKKEATLSEVRGHWKRMEGKKFMGMEFNRFYSAEARENDWVESKKNKFYNLRPFWKDIFK